MFGFENAYQRVESLFSRFRAKYGGNKFRTAVETPRKWEPAPLIKLGDSNSRVVLPIGEGLVAKVRPYRGEDYDYIELDPKTTADQGRQEIWNAEILTRKGIEVPYHDVVGLRLDDDKIVVDPQGYGVTITKDLSHSGRYAVGDVDELLPRADNREEVMQQYFGLLNELFRVYNDPDVEVTVNKHGGVDDPLVPLSRMLLLVVDDQRRGRVVPADLDNLTFNQLSL